MKCRLMDLGLVGYEEVYLLQRRLVEAYKQGKGYNTLLLLEHRPVFTIGRTGSLKNLLCDKKILAEKKIDLKWIDRGGDITFHGKGQLVAYPVFNLREYKCDLHKYLRALEQVIIDSLKAYGIKADVIDGKTGVWVGGKKIASIGIGVKNWIAYHGLSLNVNLDLKFFSLINPCGFNDVMMTSLAHVLNKNIGVDDIKPHIINAFGNIFGLEVLN